MPVYRVIVDIAPDVFYVSAEDEDQALDKAHLFASSPADYSITLDEVEDAPDDAFVYGRGI